MGGSFPSSNWTRIHRFASNVFPPHGPTAMTFARPLHDLPVPLLPLCHPHSGPRSRAHTGVLCVSLWTSFLVDCSIAVPGIAFLWRFARAGSNRGTTSSMSREKVIHIPQGCCNTGNRKACTTSTTKLVHKIKHKILTLEPCLRVTTST